MAAPPPLAERVAAAEQIVIGRVVGFLDRDVPASPAPRATNAVPYRIALVTVTDQLLGEKKKTTIHVGTPAPPTQNPRLPVRSYYGPRLQAGQEVMLFLRKHHEKDFLTPSAYYDVVVLGNQPATKKQADEVKNLVRLLADPKAGLTGKEAGDRFLTAALLVARYRNRPFGAKAVQLEPIDAGQSKLILKALADADWSQPVRYDQASPMAVFQRLGVTAADGFRPPQPLRNVQDYTRAARDWIRTHGDTYRIRRFVAADPSK